MKDIERLLLSSGILFICYSLIYTFTNDNDKWFSRLGLYLYDLNIYQKLLL